MHMHTHVNVHNLFFRRSTSTLTSYTSGVLRKLNLYAKVFLLNDILVYVSNKCCAVWLQFK